MREIKETLAILLKAFRYFYYENDLPRFDAFCEAALQAMAASEEHEHMTILKAVFREVLDNAEQDHKGEHLHE